MKKTKIKPKISVITLVLMLTFSAVLFYFPTASAHDPPWTLPVWAYVNATPNPVGVGQQIIIVFWPNTYPPTAQGQYGDRYTWTVEITKPDGTEETIGPYTSDPVGGGWGLYTPDQVGEYSIVAILAEHTFTGEPVPLSGIIWGAEYVGDTQLEGRSDPFVITVQQESIEAWSETPLPTEYWERPINAMNREWYKLAGNWLGGAAQTNGPTSNFAFGLGPESAHILWVTPYWSGGIMDERFGNTRFQTSHYEGLDFNPPIVLDGKIYYNVMSIPREGWRVLDLYTGEELWFHNTTGPVSGIGGGFDYTGSLQTDRLSFGQLYNYESPNQHGGFPYLWSTESTEAPFAFGAYPLPEGVQTDWRMFDSYTGNYICSIANVSSQGTQVYGKDGSILYYRLDTTNDRLTVWNNTYAIWYEDEWFQNEYWMWRPTLNQTFDGNNGFSLNVSIPDVQGGIFAVREGEFIIGGTSGRNVPGEPVQQGTLWALSLEPGDEGILLWEINFTPPQAVVNPQYIAGMFGAGNMIGPTVVPEYEVFLFEESLERKRWAYDLETGQLLWGPTPSEAQFNYYGMNDFVYQGKLFSYGYSGELIAYNIRTGDVEWIYIAEGEGFESPYGNYPLVLGCIADGKIYMFSDEHSPTQPLWRGSYLRCIDAETGEELWKINHWGNRPVIADGYLVDLNEYDNRLYCYGKGPSATTVTGPDTTIPLGEEVLIKGTVTDQSPGAVGTPAIADEYMSEWMEYIYMQQERPIAATGVTVKLSAYDPNGNYQDIGTTTVDTNGNFGKSWMPPVPGTYYVRAEFEGSESYGSSSDTTYFVVGEAPSPGQQMEPELMESKLTATEPATSEPTVFTEAPLITTEIAILLAAIIVAVAIVAGFLITKKRK